jgi:formate hydrogenlyase subunit 3/multisubunit Na+/H+ antiporter MnhD subunit
MIILIISLLYTIPLLISAVSKKISYIAGMIATGVTAILAIISLTYSPIIETTTLGSSVFGVDSLSWYFLLVGSVSWMVTSLYSISYDDYSKVVTASYHAAILSIVLLIFSRSYLPFLLAWEGMSMSGYFLISYKKNADRVPPYVFLVFGEMSTLLILLMFTYFYSSSGVSYFMKSDYSQVALLVGLIGFMVKLGITPFQMTEWLPIAHGGAPVNGSVLFSATMTMAALYSILRVISFAHPSVFIGGLLMATGAFSLLFAAIYAASSEHAKMLPAYSTIENSGAMLILVGASITSMNYGDLPLATFALAGAMVYVFTHTVSKTGLFLYAGYIEKTSGTLDLTKVTGSSSSIFSTGGLLNALSLSGLLPFGGGLGEWMLLETLFIMVTFNSPGISVLSTFTGVMASLGAGITLVAMTKYFGFGGRVRRDGPAGPKLMRPSIIASGLLALLLGLGGTLLITVAGRVTTGFTGLSTGPIITGLLAVPNGLLIASPGTNGPFGFVSPAFVGLILLSLFALIFLSSRHKKTRHVAVWNNGIAKTEEPNSFTYANTLRLTMKRVYPVGNGSNREDFTSSYDIFWIWLIVLSRHFEVASRRFALWFMNSDLSRYMVYLLLAFFAVLVYIIL